MVKKDGLHLLIDAVAISESGVENSQIDPNQQLPSGRQRSNSEKSSFNETKLRDLHRERGRTESARLIKYIYEKGEILRLLGIKYSIRDRKGRSKIGAELIKVSDMPPRRYSKYMEKIYNEMLEEIQSYEIDETNTVAVAAMR